MEGGGGCPAHRWTGWGGDVEEGDWHSIHMGRGHATWSGGGGKEVRVEAWVIEAWVMHVIDPAH